MPHIFMGIKPRTYAGLYPKSLGVSYIEMYHWFCPIDSIDPTIRQKRNLEKSQLALYSKGLFTQKGDNHCRMCLRCKGTFTLSENELESENFL